MSESRLTSAAILSQNSDAISKANTFEPRGISEKAAAHFLNTPEGIRFREALIEADPSADMVTIRERAIGQLQSGSTLPRLETSEEPLVKIVPKGEEPSPRSPFFARRSAFETALSQGQNLSDYFGLPIKSEAQIYDIYEIKPQGRTAVFINTVAPTEELGGLVRKPGGAEQILVPNRKLYGEAIRIGSIGNDLALHEELLSSRGLAPAISAAEDVAAARSASVRQAKRVLGIAGLALEAYDVANTTQTVTHLRGEGNDIAADSHLVHFGARGIGGWGGMKIGLAAGAAMGVETGPGALVSGGIGGFVGAVAGEKIAQWSDNRRIYNQEIQGTWWKYDPDQPERGWTRKAPIDRTADGISNAHRDEIRASPATENELNYKATSTSVQLILGSPPAQRNPFSLPAQQGDTPSSPPSNWERSNDTGEWHRTVHAPFVERQAHAPPHEERANPERAAQLDQQMARVIVENASNSPASIAARYEDAYIRNGWAAYGPVPEAVRNARTDTATLIASDGDRYQRKGDGNWVSDGLLIDSTAHGALKDELDATREVLLARLPPPREIPPVPAMDADARLRDTVIGAYRNAGVENISADQARAAASAVRATWSANGLDPATTALQALPHPDGRYDATSPLASMKLEADGRTYTIAATTSTQEILRAGAADVTLHQDNARHPANSTATTQEKSPTASTNGNVTQTHAPALDADSHFMLQRFREQVARLDARAGKPWDENSERLSASALLVSMKHGFTAKDDVRLAFNTQTDRLQAGEVLHVLRQGTHASPDPSANRASIPTEQALALPAEQRLTQAALMSSEAQASAQILAASQPQNEITRQAPRMV